MEQKDYQQLASQLSNPTGEDGIRTANDMQVGNGDMIKHAIDMLLCEDDDVILEMGPGNGAHLPYIFNTAKNITYCGIDVSETMIEEATKLNAEKVAKYRAAFVLGNGIDLPFEDNYFDKVFTVNTLYFWKDPAHLLSEIRRTMVRGGTFCLAFRSKEFMQQLPFTQYGFKLYDEAMGTALLERAGFEVVDNVYQKETTMSVMGQEIEKDYIILVAEKL